MIQIGEGDAENRVERFDQEHDVLLRQVAAAEFTIWHQIWLHAYTPIASSDSL